MTRLLFGIALLLGLTLGLTSPSLAARRQAFDVTGTIWNLDTKTRAIGVAPGITSRRTKAIAGTAAITFGAGGALTLVTDGRTFGGTWSQSGKNLDVTIEDRILDVLDDQCDALLNDGCTFTSLKVKANATVRRGTARLKFKLITRTKVRFRGVNVRVTSTVKGKGFQTIG